MNHYTAAEESIKMPAFLATATISRWFYSPKFVTMELAYHHESLEGFVSFSITNNG
jgi:hypothetical protein